MKKEIISHCCFSGHLQSNGHNIHLQCVSWYKNTAQLSTYVDDNKIDLVIGIHALRAGKLLYGESVRRILFLELTGQSNILLMRMLVFVMTILTMIMIMIIIMVMMIIIMKMVKAVWLMIEVDVDDYGKGHGVVNKDIGYDGNSDCCHNNSVE